MDSLGNDFLLGELLGVLGIFVDLKFIYDSLFDIRENMVKKLEMKVMMILILEVMKKD